MTIKYAFDALGRRSSKTVDSVTTYFFYDPQGRVIAEYEGSTPELTREYVFGNSINEILAMFTPYHEGDPDDWDDFIEFVEAWLCEDGEGCYVPGYDHDDDDIINFEDFAYFAGIWDIPSNKESDWYYLTDALGSVRGLVGGRFQRENDREFWNYDVYGNLSIQDGEESKSGNTFLYAGYYYNLETGLYYTKFRTYDPAIGYWLQLDPIGYANSMNLYQYVISNPTNYNDPFGLRSGYEWKDDSESRLKDNEHHARLVRVRKKWNQLAHKAETDDCYTICEAIVDLAQWMLTSEVMKSEYLHWYNYDETKFVHDLGFVLGGVDSSQSIWDWSDEQRNEAYMGNTRPSVGYTGFNPELNDNSNTIRHIFTMLSFAYEYGNMLGNIAGFWRDHPWRDGIRQPDRIAAYVAADLAEEMDDAFELFGGWDLDDFGQAFAEDFCDEETVERLNKKYFNK